MMTTAELNRLLIKDLRKINLFAVEGTLNPNGDCASTKEKLARRRLFKSAEARFVRHVPVLPRKKTTAVVPTHLTILKLLSVSR